MHACTPALHATPQSIPLVFCTHCVVRACLRGEGCGAALALAAGCAQRTPGTALGEGMPAVLLTRASHEAA
eukprot:366384-Chlamydomonas_euryale.AAC.6